MKRIALGFGLALLTFGLLGVLVDRHPQQQGTDSVNAGAITDTTCMMVIAEALNPTEAGATDDFLNLTDGTFSATETDEDEFTISAAMVASTLRVDIATAPGVGNDDWSIFVNDDGVATALTCVISEANTSCTDASNTPTIAAGSDITVLIDSAVGGGADPTGTLEMRIAFCLSPD